MSSMATVVSMRRQGRDGETITTRREVERVSSAHLIRTFQANCVVLRLRVSLPPISRTSRKATETAHKKYRTDNGRYTARVIDEKLYKELHACAERARRYLVSVSVEVPSGYLVRVGTFVEVSRYMARFARDFQETVERHTQDWDAYIEKVNKACGRLYGASVLPETRDEYMACCVLDFDALPMVSTPAQAMLPADCASELVAKIEKSVHEEYQGVLRSCCRKLSTMLGTVVERLRRETPLKGVDLLIVAATVRHVEQFNLVSDPDLAAFLASARRLGTGVDAKRLNSNRPERLRLAAEVEALRASVERKLDE